MSGCESSCCGSNNNSNEYNNLSLKKQLRNAILSFIIMFIGIILEHKNYPLMDNELFRFFWYFLPYILVGFPVIRDAVVLIRKGNFFNELMLMSVATIGAFSIQEYSEGLGVMVFYTIGEIFQGSAVTKAKKNIRNLLDARPDIAYVMDGDTRIKKIPNEVHIGDILEIRPGEKAPLDGTLLVNKALFNTSALTGESVPRIIKQNEEVLAGMIASDQVVRIQVNREYQDSALSRILKMVQEATENKSPTEQLIRKFAKVYTPIVFILALLVIIIPFFILITYNFQEWFYNALVFLVMSCPCALVISVPLGFFGGIGLGSKNGILFKGGNYLEALTHLKYLITDKTGTMTKGVFEVQNIDSHDINFLSYLISIEQYSNHPIAKAISQYGENNNIMKVMIQDIKEIAGFGIIGSFEGDILLAGNIKLMEKYNIRLPNELYRINKSLVICAYKHKYIGSVIVADQIKDDAYEAIRLLHKNNVKVIMLSGDKKILVNDIGHELGIDEIYGDLLPEDKANFVKNLKKENKKKIIAFVGDGINDAPVIALSDIGIAMGSLGSDLAIETADIIIQTDEPSKIAIGMKIAKMTRNIVMQNIIFAMGVKLIILFLGVNGLATMWEAIFADVGVSILAILNSMRLLYKKV